MKNTEIKGNDVERKEIFRHIRAVTGGMLILGFTVQIVLGMVWMCGNFTYIQRFSWHNLGRVDSGEEGFGLFRNFYEQFAQLPWLLYLLQLGLGFAAGYIFLTKHGEKKSVESISGEKKRKEKKREEKKRVEDNSEEKKNERKNGEENRGRKRAFAAWGSLALLTFPFAMQCHLALLPYSAMASFFLLMLSFLLELTEDRKRKWKPLLSAILCGALALALSGAVNRDEREAIWGRGPEAALASRMAWPDIWNDYDGWSEELKEITASVVWEASYYPGNMEMILQAIEEAVGPEAAKDYYMQIAGIGWNKRAYMVVRQIGWDILGYGAVPLIFSLQLEGRAYDSYTGRNYEIMREHTPVLTKYYVDYGCWWFGCSLVLTVLWAAAWIGGRETGRKIPGGFLKPAGICIAAAGIPVLLYTMRGAGLMDYRCTVGINQLWLIPALACAGACRINFRRRDDSL